ncbi:MAG: GPP34 family phosphoprotein [Defluviicoccus sp.]|nr:GPP34 family phosphoprotein [Defluviicoccus sp.]MDE0274350.1 GPP34 family phosphoprotein [Defluviicoccus sp.]
MLSFTEELLLLLLDEEGGTAAAAPSSAVACAFAGAVLMDLAFANRIDTDPATLFVVDRTPTGNPALDRVLARIGGLEEAADARSWIAALSEREARIARDRATVSLVRRGILRLPENSFHWVFGARGSAVAERAARRDVRLRVGDALFSGDIPAPRDAALIGLADACGMLGGLFPDRDMEACRPRIETLRAMELIAREIPGAISDIENGVRHLAAEYRRTSR